MKVQAQLFVDGLYIKDAMGRVRILRGCNLGGDSKRPIDQTAAGSEVSFVGRPFPIEEADEHLARLQAWGFTFLRFVITWEAVEHAGPGLYDEAYLAYLREVLKKCENFGISVFIDPHQDVWSRWTGGDGAPRWTLEALGFDLNLLYDSGASFAQDDVAFKEGREKYREMSWPLNYLRYANATMWTLFFGGNTFAPSTYVDGIPIQDWLQEHFINAMKHTARRIKDCSAVVGFGTLNEPHSGFIGLKSLHDHARITSPEGEIPSAFQAIVAASGFTQEIRYVKLSGKITLPRPYLLNPRGVSLFKPGFTCPWKKEGVWDVLNERPLLLKPEYFVEQDFGNKYLKPFQKKFMEALYKKHEHYIFFIEGVPMAGRAQWIDEDKKTSEGDILSIVEAFHWYDGATLLFKKWRPWLSVDSETEKVSFGPGRAASGAQEQLHRLSNYPKNEGIPALLGEFGCPFDLDRGASYKSGDYTKQEEALGSWYDAIDRNLLHSTVWNYSATNTHKTGDGWNTEDLSIYCADTKEGRGVKGFSRPYAMAISGIPLEMHFDRQKKIFELSWEAIEGTSEIFVPAHWYPESWDFSYEGESSELEAKVQEQRLLVHTKRPGKARVCIFPRK